MAPGSLASWPTTEPTAPVVGGDEHRLAGLWRDDLVQAVPGRDAGHAERTEIGLDRRRLGVDDAQAFAVAQRVTLPAAASSHDRVARNESADYWKLRRFPAASPIITAPTSWGLA